MKYLEIYNQYGRKGRKKTRRRNMLCVNIQVQSPNIINLTQQMKQKKQMCWKMTANLCIRLPHFQEQKNEKGLKIVFGKQFHEVSKDLK